MPESDNAPVYRKILVIRTDRLGDVILSLPVLTALKNSFPAVHVSMMLRTYTAELVAGYPDVDEIITLDDKTELNSFSDIRYYANLLKKKKIDTVLVLHPTFKLALLCALAKIPVRVGTGFRAYSFLFNKKVFHHRKKAQKHELEYNLELAEKIGASLKQIEFKIQIPEPISQEIHNFLHQVRENEKQPVVILHPGSGGSAMDWPLQNFASLNDQLRSELNVLTIVTGGPNEIGLIDNLISQTKNPPVKWIGNSGLKHLAALIQAANVFVANSTGPLHLAVAVGTPVVGFYCPIIPCLPKRWGPYGHLESVLMPPVEPCQKCASPKCNHNNCMELITVESAFGLIKKKIQNNPKNRFLK